MLYYVAENPWYLAGVFGLLSVSFLIALRVTQDGKFLIRALIALGLAAIVLVVEQLWVTDNERIEWVVKDLVSALSRSDADKMIGLMDQHVTFSLRSSMQGDELDTDFFRSTLQNAKFDWVHLSKLTTNAGVQSQRGSAEFKISATGTYLMGGTQHNFAGNSQWSLGFRKAPNEGWKITRITAVVLPPYVILPMVKFRSRNGTTAVEPPMPQIPQMMRNEPSDFVPLRKPRRGERRD